MSDREEWEKKPWESRGYYNPPDYPWNKELMSHGYLENGPGSITMEEMYQAFKARLMAELRLVDRDE